MEMLRLQEAEWKFASVGFTPTSKINAYLSATREEQPRRRQSGEPRDVLRDKRLEEAFMRYSVITHVQRHEPSLAPNINLKFRLDDILTPVRISCLR